MVEKRYVVEFYDLKDEEGFLDMPLSETVKATNKKNAIKKFKSYNEKI